MCETCGCGDTTKVSVEMHEHLLADNDRAAAHNREHFEAAGVTAINVMGSPGSGKTALLEATAARLRERRRLVAISGDLETDRDARRLERAGIQSVSITTGSACHLDARMVHRALHETPWKQADYLFIENVGNLVCPAIYDLGEAARVVVLSITEGEDKPLKYPIIFRRADAVVVTKCDLLAALPEYELASLDAAIARVMPRPAVIHVSARTGAGLDAWLDWLESLRTTASATPHAPARAAR